jgi:hypothetical protein
LRVSKEGPRVLSRDALKTKGYPEEPSRPFYLVYDVTPAEGFDGYEWDYHKLPDRLLNRASAHGNRLRKRRRPVKKIVHDQ